MSAVARWSDYELALLATNLPARRISELTGRTVAAVHHQRLRHHHRLPIPHGTPNGYHNYNCHCLPCRAAWRDDYRERQANNKRRCSRPDCDRPHYGRGYCKPHYMRDRRGDPLDTPIIDRPNGRGRKPGKDRPKV